LQLDARPQEAFHDRWFGARDVLQPADREG
jgi:hypothetical protein